MGFSQRNRSSSRARMQIGGRAVGVRQVEPAQQHHRRALVGLAHQQRGRRRDLVGDADLGRAQLAAEQVGRAAQVEQRRQAGGAERHADRAVAPGAAEAVDDEHARLDAGARSQAARGSRGRSGCSPPAAAARDRRRRRRWRRRCRRWPARCRCGARPPARPCDAAPPRSTRARISSTSRGSLSTSAASSSARADGVTLAQIDHAAFGLGDDLLRDHHDVAAPQAPGRKRRGPARSGRRRRRPAAPAEFRPAPRCRSRRRAARRAFPPG